MLEANAEVATTLVKATAKRGSDVTILTIAVRGLAVIDVKLAALKLAREEDVVDARDGARTVGG